MDLARHAARCRKNDRIRNGMVIEINDHAVYCVF
jgi:ribosome-associated protein YbcJ (S4-like RNA binding protein)